LKPLVQADDGRHAGHLAKSRPATPAGSLPRSLALTDDIATSPPPFGKVKEALTMNLEHSFLGDVCDNPDDDAPRLIYADWLDERAAPGDADRAEFIRAQCALAKLPATAPQRPDLERRQQGLLAAHRATWEAPLRPLLGQRELTFERGFVTGLALTPEELLSLGEWLFRAAPVQRIRFEGESEGHPLDKALLSPLLARVTALTINHGLVLTVSALASSPCRRRLQHLDLSGTYLRPFGAQALSELRLPKVRRLRLVGCFIGDVGAHVLAQSPCLGRLTELALDSNDIGPSGVRALASSHSLPALTTLSLDGNRIGPEGARALAGCPRLLSGHVLLSLNGGGIGDWGARALAAVPVLRRITELRLRNNQIGPAGARALAESPYLTNLTSLDLSRNQVRDQGAQALASSPHLGNLTVLRLHDNQIRVGGARALASSRHLARLVRLSLGANGIGAEGAAARRERFGQRQA
jgi:uncharacterized protein (TIGR02996 family)